MSKLCCTCLIQIFISAIVLDLILKLYRYWKPEFGGELHIKMYFCYFFVNPGFPISYNLWNCPPWTWTQGLCACQRNSQVSSAEPKKVSAWHNPEVKQPFVICKFLAKGMVAGCCRKFSSMSSLSKTFWNFLSYHGQISS